jgi:hypothetical protein
MTTNFELTPEQSEQASRLLDAASAMPSRSAGVVLGQIHRREAKIVLTMKVVSPDRAMRIAKILKT